MGLTRHNRPSGRNLTVTERERRERPEPAPTAPPGPGASGRQRRLHLVPRPSERPARRRGWAAGLALATIGALALASSGLSRQARRMLRHYRDRAHRVASDPTRTRPTRSPELEAARSEARLYAELVTRGAARTEKFLSAPRVAEALTALNDTAHRADQGLQHAVDEFNDSTEEVLGHAALYGWRLRRQISHEISRRTTAAASTLVDRWLPRPSRTESAANGDIDSHRVG